MSVVCKYKAVHIFITRKTPICDLTLLYETGFNTRHTKDPAEESPGINVNINCITQSKYIQGCILASQNNIKSFEEMLLLIKALPSISGNAMQNKPVAVTQRSGFHC